MQADNWSKILGETIPNALKAVDEMNKAILPIAAQLNNNREQLEKTHPDLLKRYDQAMQEVAEASAKLKQNGGNGN